MYDGAWWEDVERAFTLQPWHAATLAAARQAYERWREIVQTIDADGLVVEGARGSKRHPLLAAETQARDAFIRALRALELEEPE